MQQQSKRLYNLIIFLIGALLSTALCYTLETNEVTQSKQDLTKTKKAINTLTLAHQQGVEQLSLINLSQNLSQVQEELKLEQVKEFTLLHPKANQLSLNQPFPH